MMDSIPSLDEKTLKLPEKQQALRVVYTQVVCTIGVTVFFAFYSKLHSLSALYGALTIIFPTLLLIWKLFPKKPQTAQQRVKAFYKAEALKWLSCVALLILCITFFKIEPLAYFVSFAAGLFAYWIAFARSALSQGALSSRACEGSPAERSDGSLSPEDSANRSNGFHEIPHTLGTVLNTDGSAP